LAGRARDARRRKAATRASGGEDRRRRPPVVLPRGVRELDLDVTPSARGCVRLPDTATDRAVACASGASLRAVDWLPRPS
jgi:hypothetical protein